MKTIDITEIASSAFIISDFDGTLSEIVTTPATAVFVDGAVEVLLSLTQKFKSVSILSGRPSSFILELISHTEYKDDPRVKNLNIYGLYGNELLLEKEELKDLIRSVYLHLRSELEDSVFVEDKILSVAVHYRNCEDKKGEIQALVRKIISLNPNLYEMDAKKCFEIIPSVFVNKSFIVGNFLRESDGGCYLGDDLVDLEVFKLLKDTKDKVTVSVGVRGNETPQELLETADFVVDGPNGALEFLKKLDEDSIVRK